MSKFIPVEYDFGTDLVVIGNNPENADYDNPRGDIFGVRSYVRAIDKDGNTMMLYSSRASRDEKTELDDAEQMAARLNDSLIAGWTPDFENRRWVVGRPVYGSLAYQQYGQQDDLEWERSGGDEDNF